MKIAGSQIVMKESHEYQETRQITVKRGVLLELGRTFAPDYLKLDRFEFSDQAQAALNEAQKNEAISENPIMVNNVKPMEKLKMQVLDGSISAISGRSLNIDPIVSGRRQVTGLFFTERRETYRESEQMSFTANGIVKTADGKEIDFSVALNMSREFATEKLTITLEEGRLKDPLVINFDGPAAALTETKFSFDLDNDGALDQISFLKSGSGFLALDQNQDGLINNGGELFGTASGNGFADLLKYDSDQNGWIDENDSIFEKLRIWTKNENGEDMLFALGQKGVGAIYLGNIDTQFSFKDAANQTQGQLRRTGVFLKEDGTAGTVQQIDLVV
ncbi:MAG TPA: hypothetical protein VHY08_27325 [Bacillota bacterium]|nr:hypothetical protein [Bacillota bacterium]